MQQTILLTGGTGSFGTAFVEAFLSEKQFTGVIRIFSRDEYKQHTLAHQFDGDPRLRFFIGDVRDKDRLRLAIDGVDVVIHAAALKHVEVAEYNPFEVIKTNIIGSQNVIEAALDARVKKNVLISSDKAVHPNNLYGASKLVAERLFIHGNSYVGERGVMFAVARFGNIAGSRGSVVPLFLKQKKNGIVTITHKDMTRFWITLPRMVEFVKFVLRSMKGGEIFVPKLPVISVLDVAKTIAPQAKFRFTGKRLGDKIHEELLSEDEKSQAVEFPTHYLIAPHLLARQKKMSMRTKFWNSHQEILKTFQSYAQLDDTHQLFA